MSGEGSHRDLVSILTDASEALHVDELDKAVRGLGRAVGASATLLGWHRENGMPQPIAGDLAPQLGAYARGRRGGAGSPATSAALARPEPR